MSATATFTVDFHASGRSGMRPMHRGCVPRVARLLALAHTLDAKIRAGELDDMAHAAKVCGVTRPRVTQIMNLLLLAPEIQEAILDMPPVTTGRDPVTERTLRPIVAKAEWTKQGRLWNHGVDLEDQAHG